MMLFMSILIWGHHVAAQVTNVTFPSANLTYLGFFQQYPRLHLAEGTFQKWIYNLDAYQCAQRCVFSGYEAPENIPCRSFDLYVFEDYRPNPPWYETTVSGICVLNSGSVLNSRLRFEDDGWTDAELTYTSHFTHRFETSHFDAIDAGYDYNPLIYNATSPNRIPWLVSRAGAVILEEPQVNRIFYCLPDFPGSANLTATVIANSSANNVRFTRAGFTPVNAQTGKCFPMLSRIDATAACTQAGADLCTQRDLRMLFNENLGCDIDGVNGVLPIWAFDDIVTPATKDQLKYVKCCTQHQSAFTCESYTRSNINMCRTFTNENDCVKQGSGFTRQFQYGYGYLLQLIRQNCLRDTISCGDTPLSLFTARDQCIWCGNDCRAGSDFGICANDPTLMNTFAKQFAVTCTPQAACDVTASYPELEAVLVSPYEVQGGDSDGTRSPTVPIKCQTLKTPQTCFAYYDDCYWGTWYGTPTCRPLSTWYTSRPTPRPKKNPKRKG